MPLPFSNPHTQADLQQLSSLFASLMTDHFRSTQLEIRLLNIACGRADETGVLASSLAPHCQQLELTGIDIRNREIGEAKQRWCKMRTAKAQFYTQDASQIAHIHQLDDAYDVVFIRHQNYWNGAETWQQIYDNALHRLSNNGILVITSYFDREHLQAVQAISTMGGILTTNIRNPKSRIITDAPNKSVDRHIAIFKSIEPSSLTVT